MAGSSTPESARPPQRLAVLTFVYEADQVLVFDTLDSVARSCAGADIDFFVTDDGSPSNVGDTVAEWCRSNGFGIRVVRFPTALGYRGAIERTLTLLKEVARSDRAYDLVLRIDTDAMVVRDGLAEWMREACTDPRGLYGVTRSMRRKDGLALLLDLLPMGLRRQLVGGRLDHRFVPTRLRPVWWWRIGLKAFRRGGFRFRFADGCCYILGSAVAPALNTAGYLDAYQDRRVGLITSEEDVILTMMCRAERMKVYGLETLDPTWATMNWIGADALAAETAALPFVIHPLKATPEGLSLRAKLRQQLPLFRSSARD